MHRSTRRTIGKKPTTLWDGLLEFLPISEYSAGSGPVARKGLHKETRWTDPANLPSGLGLQYGYSGEFAQASGHTLTCSDASLFVSGSFTLAAWVRRTENDAEGYRGILTHDGFNLFLTNDHTIVSDVGATNYHNADFGGVPMSRLDWHLVRCWYDASAGTWNNQLDLGAKGTWIIDPPAAGASWVIGERATAKYWGGNIGPVMWWSRVLDDAEWSELYNRGYGVKYSGHGLLSRSTGGAVDWYSVAGRNCVGAYQAKGAASYAESLVNLANPGTNDLAEIAAPTWSAGTGWTGNGSSMALDTGLYPVSNLWTLIVRVSGGTNAAEMTAFGASGYDGGYGAFYSRLQPRSAPNAASYWNGSAVGERVDGSLVESGVMAVAGNVAYLDGASIGSWTLGVERTASYGSTLKILAEGKSNNATGQFFAGSVQAAVAYDSILTAGEVATVCAAMAAL